MWNVVAAPEFSVEPRRWCFPVAGCVAYRGYFNEPAARAAAGRLARDGDDVTVGGVATYSTLGRLPDPVFNTMLAWTEVRLVGTVFHELAHERLYVPGDSEFNEAFASVVEQEGVQRWLAAQGDVASLERYRATLGREAEFAALLRAARERLAHLYASAVPGPDLWLEKQREFGRLKFEYAQLRAQLGRLLRLRRLVCAPAEQRAPGGGGDLPRLRAGAAAGARRGRVVGGVLRARCRVGRVAGCAAAGGGVRGA